ncbi:hypothetical protein K1T71_015077 [Dendrolimus kikuchii]|nr:hypothetical protein K1T71_015077 [Dendrolimus kikuchii]
MRCCVPYCTNDSKHISKAKGITFHLFPNEPTLRKVWQQALGKADWTPKERSTICAEHFLPEDFYETKSGLRKVRNGAVPIIVKSEGGHRNSCTKQDRPVLFGLVCRICLAIDSKLYPISSYKLGQAYEHVTGLSLTTEDRLPQKVCTECATRLSNCVKFRNKGLRANALMLEILKRQDFHYMKHFQQKKIPAEPKIDRRRKPFLNDDLNETLFTIMDLSFEEQIAEIEKRRESANYKNSVFKCEECFKGFLDEHAYTTHMTRHTDQCGEHECEICKTHFKHPHALRKHITCSYVTTHRQTARLHERWHKGTKYRCPHCQDEFVKFTTYMGHIRIKHPSDFVCELCGYSFVSAKGIELHKKLKHRLDDAQIPEDGPYCDPCNVRFVSQEAYRRHLNANKGKTRRPRETKSKERKRELELEEKRVYPSQIRRAEGPIPCEQCGLQLEDSRAYHGHFRRMHPDKNRTNYPSMKSPCMCEVCGRMFQSYALLKDHTWVHTGERPFKCDSCDKSFRMKQRLVAHRRVHSQLKRTYVCTVCEKHFSTHSNRQRHMFIHTGLKPFKCEMCGKGFKHASEKRAHITYVHLKKPWPKRTRAKRRPDGRTGQMQLPPSLPTSGSEMDIQPIWPPCDPKLNEINSIMDDKPLYYNLKQVI